MLILDFLLQLIVLFFINFDDCNNEDIKNIK